jgi:hypothetical protein
MTCQHQSFTSRSTCRRVRRGRASFGDASPSSATLRKKSKSTLGRTYEWFLELPVPIVLLTMWIAGMLLISSLVGLLYLLGSLLLMVATTS